MKQKIQFLIGLPVALLLSSFSFSAEEWTLLAEEGSAKVYYKLGTCEERNVMFLKFENTSGESVRVDFHLVLENNPPAPQRIEINGNSSLSGQCTGTPDLVKDVSSSQPSPVVTMRIVN